MHSLAHDFAAGILRAPEPPCLSLYQPTHRSYPDNQQDPIRFRNLVKALEGSLRQGYAKRDIRPLLEPFRQLAADREFWEHTQNGLAVLAAPGLFRAYRLQRPVPELAVVADSFHLKPLIRIVQSADRFQVLGLNRQEVKLYEGNRDALDEVELAPAVPRTIADVVDSDLKELHVTAWTHGSGSAAAAVHSGHSTKEDVADADTGRFFRAVDRAVLEHHSRPSGLSLILAALPEHQTRFRELSQNPLLLDEGIEINPGALSIEELRAHAWRVVEPHYLARLAGLVAMFGAARSRELGTADVAEAANGAVAGRVATLLIDADRHLPGRIDTVTGAVTFDSLADPEVDDLLDDLGELVLKNGGQVVIVPAERMPTETGVAAIYRF